MRHPLTAGSRPWVVTAALLAACGQTPPEPEILSDYTLNLVPRLLPGQDPFADEPTVKLVVRHAGGGQDLHFVGRAQGGQVELPELGTLDAGTRVGVLLEEPGGASDVYNEERLIAYGEVVLAEDLGTDGATVEAQVLVPQFGEVGDLGRLQGNKKSFRPAAAMLPDGEVYLFGGAADLLPTGNADPSHGKIFRMAALDEGDWTFEKVGDLPEYTLTVQGDFGEPSEQIESAGRVGALASVIAGDDGPLILVSGGRHDYATSGANVDTALLYDPASGEVVEELPMLVARSDHGALTLTSGDVLLYGGFQGVDTGFDLADPVEIFRVGDRRFERPDGAHTVGPLGVAAAGLGLDGALLCGGATSSGTSWAPVADCEIVNLSGLVLPAPPLPVGVALHAMAPLPDGGVLACGGVLDPVEPLGTQPATDRAWVYDGEAWEEVAPMAHARAHHVAIPTPSGKVVVVGGGPTGGPVLPDPGEPVVCTEIFDPATREFTTAACTNSGSGAYPSWSAVHGEGAFVLAGFESYTSPVGGDNYGFIGFGPDL